MIWSYLKRRQGIGILLIHLIMRQQLLVRWRAPRILVLASLRGITSTWRSSLFTIRTSQSFSARRVGSSFSKNNHKMTARTSRLTRICPRILEILRSQPSQRCRTSKSTSRYSTLLLLSNQKQKYTSNLSRKIYNPNNNSRNTNSPSRICQRR